MTTILSALSTDPVTLTAWAALLTALVSAIAFAVRTRRASGRWSLAIAAGVNLFSSGVTAALSAGHLVAVLIVELRRSPVIYDFRFYSLLLLGVVNGTLALAALRVARRLAAGEREARRTAMRAMLGLLVVNVPLGPIQGFATALAIFASLDLIALALARHRASEFA